MTAYSLHRLEAATAMLLAGVGMPLHAHDDAVAGVDLHGAAGETVGVQ
jgi:hypothetical protein